MRARARYKTMAMPEAKAGSIWRSESAMDAGEYFVMVDRYGETREMFRLLTGSGSG